MKKLSCFMVVLVMFVAPKLFAQTSGIYLRAKFMPVAIEHASVSGWSIKAQVYPAFGIAVGYDFDLKKSVPINLEFEYVDRNWSNTYLGKVFYNFKTGSIATPYLNAGLGMASVSAYGITAVAFTFDIGGGVDLKLLDNFSLYFSYDFIPGVASLNYNGSLPGSTDTDTIYHLYGTASVFAHDIAVGGKIRF